VTLDLVVARGVAFSAALAAACLAVAGCGGGEEKTADPGELAVPGKEVAVLSLTSTAFEDGGTIPVRHTCDGDDVSPPLAWTGLPDGTRSLALLVDDPDAPGGTFTHWLAWDIDPAGELAEGAAPPGEGANGFGSRGYRGPCPPKGGPHRYVFRLYALDAPLAVDAGADKASFQDAVAGHLLGVGELTGTYGRG
jgi:Raf kinase inhibitor-like YbhB/YbcL family protein